MTRNEPLTPPSIDWLDRTRNQLLMATPFYLLVPVLFFGLFRAWDLTPSWSMMGFGALGWMFALMLRGPVAVLAQKFAGTPEKAGTWVVASSGPLEETVRAIAVLWLGRDLATALAIGLGWAAIEVVFALVNSFVGNVLLRSDDPKAVEARELLAQQNTLSGGPWWGILERITASALHIGNTLIVAWMPLAALLLAPIHSALNMGILRLTQRSMGQSQALLAVAGGLTFALGLILFQL